MQSPASSEAVDIKYRGVVDLKPFTRSNTPRSSFVRRVCYDKAQSYMLINLRGNLTDPAEVVRISAEHEVDFLPPEAND